MALYLEDATTGRQLRLWNGQELASGTTVSEEVYNPATLDASETVLSVLQAAGDITVDGIVLGPQRIREGATSASEPTTAVAEWLARLEAWVNGAPGTASIQLRNDATGRTTSVAPRAMTWSRSAGNRNAATYGVELAVGGGVDADTGIDPDSVAPGGTDTYDGVELPHVYERSVDKQLELSTFEELFADSAEENEQIVASAATRSITLLGEFVGDLAAQRAFDDELRSRAGVGETFTFSSAFPGLSTEAAILSYESTREAGVTQRGEYAVELLAGQAI
jgi:hypothetical protein